MQQANGQNLFSRYEKLFITGTDTGIGKTSVATALALEASDQGLAWHYFKPAESGDDSDAGTVSTVTGRPGQVTVGYHLTQPLAPQFAAEEQGLTILPETLDEKFQALKGSPLLVEGAGGLLVPYTPGILAADLALRWRLPLLIVTGNKLGCLNHTLLTIEAAQQRGLEVAGCVFNDLVDDPTALRNVADFRRLSTIPVLAWLRRLSQKEKPAAAWWREGVLRAAS